MNSADEKNISLAVNGYEQFFSSTALTLVLNKKSTIIRITKKP